MWWQSVPSHSRDKTLAMTLYTHPCYYYCIYSSNTTKLFLLKCYRECEEKLRQAHKTKINNFNLLIFIVGAGASLKKDSTNYLVLYDVCSLIRVLHACQ